MIYLFVVGTCVLVNLYISNLNWYIRSLIFLFLAVILILLLNSLTSQVTITKWENKICMDLINVALTHHFGPWCHVTDQTHPTPSPPNQNAFGFMILSSVKIFTSEAHSYFGLVNINEQLDIYTSLPNKPPKKKKNINFIRLNRNMHVEWINKINKFIMKL